MIRVLGTIAQNTRKKWNSQARALLRPLLERLKENKIIATYTVNSLN